MRMKSILGACCSRIAGVFNAICARLVCVAFPSSQLRRLTGRILVRRQAVEKQACVTVVARKRRSAYRWIALQLIRSANLARSQRKHAKATDLLLMAIALAPQLPEPLLALRDLLDESFRYLDAERRIAEDIRLCPSSAALRLMLAYVQFQRRHLDDALQTTDALIAIAPDCAKGWYQQGKILSVSFERLGMADKAFERAADMCGNDYPLLELIAQHFLYELEYKRAAEYYERLIAGAPGALENPVTCRHYARSLREKGRGASAQTLLEKGLKSCQTISRRSSGDALGLAMRERALLYFEAGQLDDADTELRKTARVAGSAPDFDRAEYLPGTRTRVERMSKVIDGRDLFIMLQGPSFADFVTHAHEFGRFDFAVATINSFPPIEEELSRGINRGADILLISHPGTIQAWHRELEDFLSRSSPNLLVTTRYALSALNDFGSDQDAFITRHDERLLLIQPYGGPPIPSRPLHFEHGSTISFLIPLLLFSRPRRIFLFGADGGANPSFEKRAYFFYDDYDAKGPAQAFLNKPDMVSFNGKPDRLNEANRRLRVSAINADRIIAAALRTLEVTLRVKVPPIFNVCPHSAHALFPRINVDAALAELRNSDGS